ncbi:MAG: TonB-dependent receptor [Leptospirales bacterium]|nr:TonB-dependent receptor [Leptospirales bacterium]
MRILKKYWLRAAALALIAWTPLLYAQATGRIVGRIVDQQGEAAFGTAVTVQGVPGAAATVDFDGRFSLSVPPGQYNLLIQGVGVAPQSVAVTVVAGQTATVNRVVSPPVAQEATVAGRAINNTEASQLALQRRASTVSDGISQEAIRRTPDSSAGDALRRVTGVTLVGGKYVFVRGLGERYSNTELNGALVSSPEPDRRVVPLDLFPASLIKNMQVIKTFIPEMSGDFSGGIVRIETQEFPDEFTMTLGLGSGGVLNETGGRFLTYRGSATDWAGRDDGFRDRPEVLELFPNNVPWIRGSSLGGLPADLVQGSAYLFPDTLNAEEIKAPFDRNFSFSIGDSLDTGFIGRFGYLFGTSYQRRWRRQEVTDNQWRAENPIANGTEETAYLLPLQSATTRNYNEEVLWGNNLNLSLEPNSNHRISSRTFLSRNSDKSVEESRGILVPAAENPLDFNTLETSWIQRQVLHEVLSGEHALTLLGDRAQKLSWNLSTSRATREQPNTAVQAWTKNAGELRLPERRTGTGNFRFYSDTEDVTDSLQADYEIPFEQWSGLIAKFKLGGYAMRRHKDYNQDVYNYLQLGQTTINELYVPGLNPAYGLTSSLLQDVTRFQEQTGLFDEYRANQRQQAYYGQVDLPLLAKLRLIAGARYEDNYQFVRTYNSSQPYGQEYDIRRPGIGELRNKDTLPSANLVWEFLQDMNLRFAYTETLNRPDFRDLSSAGFQTSFTGERVFGNPSLRRAYLHNYDARWEWYLSGEEYFGVGAFLKDISNPIEKIGLAASNNERDFTFVNARDGEIRGLEFEARRDFLERFNLSANLFLIRSVVTIQNFEERTVIGAGLTDLAAIQAAYRPTNLERPLVGQSPYVVNLRLSYYLNEDKTGSVGLLYNYFGDRLAAGGANGAPDTYERGVGIFDLVYEQKYDENLSFKAAIKNILDARFEQYIENPLLDRQEILTSYRDGVGLSASLNYRF